MTKYSCLLICFFIISCSDKSTHELEPILESNLKMNKMMAEDCYFSNIYSIEKKIKDESLERGLYLRGYKNILEKINEKYLKTIDSLNEIEYATKSKDFDANRIEILYLNWMDFNSRYVPTRFDSLSKLGNYFAIEFNKIMIQDSIDFYKVLSFVRKNSKYPNLGNLLLKNHMIKSFYIIQSFVWSSSPIHRLGPDFEKYAFIATSDKGVIIRNGYAEITAGMGSLDHKYTPIIKINNQTVKVNDDGISVMKVKTPSKKGKFIIPVEFTFTSQNGELKKFLKNIDIQVVDSICN